MKRLEDFLGMRVKVVRNINIGSNVSAFYEGEIAIIDEVRIVSHGSLECVVRSLEGKRKILGYLFLGNSLLSHFLPENYDLSTWKALYDK